MDTHGLSIIFGGFFHGTDAKYFDGGGAGLQGGWAVVCLSSFVLRRGRPTDFGAGMRTKSGIRGLASER